jgi:hypothetical protein
MHAPHSDPPGEPDDDPSDSRKETGPAGFSLSRAFFHGFFAGWVLMIVLNYLSYVAFSSPDSTKYGFPAIHKIGFPKIFWVEDRTGLATRLYDASRRDQPFESEFSWGALALDLVFGFALSATLGHWYAKRAKTGGPPPGDP